MYDKDTIISAFDERGTLVQWLKNLDDTLKNSTLVRIEKVETVGGFAFKFVFANGVEMLTPTVETIKSVKIEGGAQNDTFKIMLTLSDGSIISSDDFKAPVHISEINVTEITAISQASDGFTVETKMFTDINGRTGINDILVYQMPIKGSESVVVDVDETGKSAKIHLNTNILNDIAKALKIPASAPTSTEIVAVDNTGTQTMLTVGDGLSVEGSILKSTGGTSGLQVKQITFTDRPSLFSWLQSNTTKILTVIARMISGSNLLTVQFEGLNIIYPSNTSFRFQKYQTTSSSDLFRLNITTITINNTLTTIEEQRGVVFADPLVIDAYKGNDIPDEYWNNLQMSVEITYIE